MSWKELQPDEDNSLWARFYAQFNFEPIWYDQPKVPAISEPNPFETFDLLHAYNQSTMEKLDAIFEKAFAAILGPHDHVYALDWQHTTYKFDPRESSEWQFGIFPDGDYHIFLAPDFSFGTFGHPWQASLCVFGRSLLDETSEQLRTILPLARSG